jgi:hypothetical protein
VLHKQTQASPFSPELLLLPLFLSLEVLFLLMLSELELLLELLELLLELDDELLLEDELVELCCSSYFLRSSLRFCSHSEFSEAPLFLNLQIFRVTLFSPQPNPTANSGEQPLPFAGGFKTWLGLPGFNGPSTLWHSLVFVKPAFLPHLILALKSSPSARPSNPVMKLSPSQLLSSALTPLLNENSLLDSLCEEDDDEDEEELAFWDPLCSPEAQNARTVTFEYWKDWELEAD